MSLLNACETANAGFRMQYWISWKPLISQLLTLDLDNPQLQCTVYILFVV